MVIQVIIDSKPPLGIPVAGEACGRPSVLELRDSGTTSLGLLALAPLRGHVEKHVQFSNTNTINTSCKLIQIQNHADCQPFPWERRTEHRLACTWRSRSSSDQTF